jgi:hypothetical protein
VLNAAGIIFRSPEGRVLLLRRSDTEDWDYPGGKCKDGETPRQTAVREAWEEAKYRAGHAGDFLCRRVRNGVDYTTFLHQCDDEFTPKLSREHTDYMWVQPRTVLADSLKARADAYGAYAGGMGTAFWEEHKHPRGGDPENKGRFSKGHGGAISEAPGGTTPSGEAPPGKAAPAPQQPAAPAKAAAEAPPAEKETPSGRPPQPADERPGAAAAAARAVSGSYSRKSLRPSQLSRLRSDTDRARVKAVFEPQADAKAHFDQIRATSPTYHELDASDPATVEAFSKHLGESKQESEYGAAVYIYPPEDYAKMRLFTTEDGSGGFALKGEDIVSVFKKANGPKKIVASALGLAVANGGRRLDCFDTVLPKSYSASGFKAVARLKWDDSQAPEGWDKQTFAEFNGGQPDVVGMVYDSGYNEPYQAGDGEEVASYDDIQPAQEKALQTPTPRPGEAEGSEHRVSTRKPTAAGAPINASQRADFSPDLESLKSTPDKMEQVADLIRNPKNGYTKTMRVDPGATAEQVVRGFIDHAKSNLIALYNKQDKKFRERSKLWYDGANAIAKRMAKKYGLTDRQVAAVIATQSPQKDWDSNVRLGERICDIVAGKERHVKLEGALYDKFKSHMLEFIQDNKDDEEKYSKERVNKKTGKTIKARPDAAENAKKRAAFAEMLMEEFKGKSFNDIAREAKAAPGKSRQAWFLRFYDEATAGERTVQRQKKTKNKKTGEVKISTKEETIPDRRFKIYTPEGDQTDTYGKSDTGQEANYAFSGFDTIQNGIDCIEDPDNIDEHLGDMHKVRNFYNNIISPNHGEDVTIDTHAIAAALLKPLGSGHSFVNEGLGGAGPESSESGNKGLYSLYYTAYQEAADEISKSASYEGKAPLLPRQLQSIAWEALRGLYTGTQKRDENVQKHADDVWEQHAKGGENAITREQAQQQILARGIEDPRWAEGGGQ